MNREQELKRLIESRRAEQSDATRVQRQIPIQPIKAPYRSQRQNAVITSDNRSSYQRNRDQKAAQQAALDYQKQQDDLKRAQGLEQLLETGDLALNATIVGQVAKPVLKGAVAAVKYGAKKGAEKLSESAARRTLSNPNNFRMQRYAHISVPSIDESLASAGENQSTSLLTGLFKKPQLQLPGASPIDESLIPEMSYKGRIPKRTIDIQRIQEQRNAEKLLQDIAQDPENYTFEEISDALKSAGDKNQIPFISKSSGNVKYIGNSVQDELKKVNAVLREYGYDEIPAGLDDVKTRELLLDRIKQHRSFGRGVYYKPKGSDEDIAMTKQAARNFGIPEKDVTGEMKLQTAATHTIAGTPTNGRQGLIYALDKFNLNPKKYDAIYTSNRDQVMAGYSVPGYGGGSKGAAYKVSLPVRQNKNRSLTELWADNEFPITDEQGRLTEWRTSGLPYMLKTGNRLSDQAIINDVDESAIKAILQQAEVDKAKIPEPKPVLFSETSPSNYINATYYRNRGKLPHAVSYNHGISKRNGDRIINKSSDEISSYMSEIKTMLGKRDNQKLTARELDFLNRNRKIINNNLGHSNIYNYIFDRIKDPKKFAKWVNDNATMLTIPIVGGTAYKLNNTYAE